MNKDVFFGQWFVQLMNLLTKQMFTAKLSPYFNQNIAKWQAVENSTTVTALLNAEVVT